MIVRCYWSLCSSPSFWSCSLSSAWWPWSVMSWRLHLLVQFQKCCVLVHIESFRLLDILYICCHCCYSHRIIPSHWISVELISNGKFGVPQSSVLGPLLFILFINDIHLSLNNAIIKLFADDTNFFIAGDNFDLLVVTVISELQSFQEWIRAINLQLTMIPKNQVIVHLSLETNSIQRQFTCWRAGSKIQRKHKIPCNDPRWSTNLENTSLKLIKK